MYPWLPSQRPSWGAQPQLILLPFLYNLYGEGVRGERDNCFMLIPNV